MIDIAKLRKLRPYALSNAAADELARLQAANTAALKVADERSKENCALRQENERLRAALRTAFCPGGGNYLTVGECASKGVCGCDLGHTLKPSRVEQTSRENGT